MLDESEVVTSKAVQDSAPRLSQDGYGLEIQGYQHRETKPGEAMVFLESDTSYKIRLSNTNPHICMVTVELDNFIIGTFLLHPYSKCDVERPTDRPLGFTFLQTPPPLPEGQRASRSGKKKEQQEQVSHVTGVFRPETGGKIVQIYISTEHLSKTIRLELLHDTTVTELFGDLQRDFGDWILSNTCTLFHWTNAEYDSPVEDILKPHFQTLVSSFRRQDNPIRKMSLVSFEHVEIYFEGHDVIRYTLDAMPTFGKALEVVRETLDTNDAVYFLSTCDRYLCSSNWAKDATQICHTMHKDEILAKPGTIVLRATTERPADLSSTIVRMLNNGVLELEVTQETTVRECRTQLEEIGGTWGDDPRWLFGGTLMENGKNISFYGIGDRSTVDVIPRMHDTRKFNSLEMKDPISVDADTPVHTAEMIRREESRYNAMMDTKKKKKKPHRGGTTLRGRVQQQYIEVGPVETDERFTIQLAINIMPKDKEDDIVNAPTQPQRVKGGKTCTIS